MFENWQIPLLMTTIAGLATLIGGFITFLVNKNNMKILSLGLGFSAGVMIFLSVALIYVLNLCSILPLKYFVLLICILGFFVILNSYLLIKEKTKIWLKLAFSFFSIVIISMLSISLFYIEIIFIGLSLLCLKYKPICRFHQQSRQDPCHPFTSEIGR